MTINSHSLLLAGTAMLALSTPAQAQDAETEVVGIQEIVVTAQKRAENLQSTQIAVSALNEEMIRERGISTAADLTAVAPSVSVTTSPASSTNMQLFIRGIGDVEPILTSSSASSWAR